MKGTGLDAAVYFSSASGNAGWFVKLTLLPTGHEMDRAGPFDDEVEAITAAERMVYGSGTVSTHGSGSNLLQGRYMGSEEPWKVVA